MVYKIVGKIIHKLQRDCLLCHNKIESGNEIFGVCGFCVQHIPFLASGCKICADPEIEDTYGQLCNNCMRYEPYYDRTMSAVAYNYLTAKLINRFKDYSDNATRALLGELLIWQLVRRKTANRNINLVVAVPKWHSRLQTTKNHSYLLASYLSKKLQLRMARDLVLPTRPIKQQKQLNTKQRRQNVAGAFKVTRKVSGLNIAIIDDVMTTGATLDAVAKELKAAGANTVFCYTIARTIRDSSYAPALAAPIEQAPARTPEMVERPRHTSQADVAPYNDDSNDYLQDDEDYMEMLRRRRLEE